MKTPLINTKLYIPALRPNHIKRTRLINQIENGLLGKLTLISSPAGSGKSTLLSFWAAQYKGSIAWLSLDEGDNDIKRFLTYLVKSIQIHCLGCGDDLLSVLKSPSPVASERLLPVLVNDLTRVSGNLIIVLDDYQAIVQPEIHDALIFLIAHLPTTVHLIIATRNDPPFPLPKLRADGTLNEIRAADLRFSNEEASELLNTMLPQKLSQDEVAIIEARTEGWAVGLHLVGLALRVQEDISQFIHNFTGSHRFIIDYLTDEVFQQQTVDLQEFMLSISLLKKFNADLCSAVTGRGDSGRMLEFMETENLFLVALDDERRWYRYHHLFGDLLLHKLQHSGKYPMDELHSRAANWYVSNGHIADAMHHAFAMEDYNRAAEIIAMESSAMIGMGDTQTVQRWIESLPEEILRANPNLCITLAWVYDLNNKGKNLEPLLQMAEQALSTGEYDLQTRNAIHGNAAMLRAYTALGQNQPGKALQYMGEALVLLPEDDHYLRSIASFTQGVVYKRGFVWEPAIPALMDAYERGQSAGNLTLALAGIIHLIEMNITQGRLKHAAQLCRKIIKDHKDLDMVPNLGFVHTKLAEIQYEWNEQDAALESLERGFKFIEKMFADIGWTRDAFMCLMRVKQVRGEPDAARTALRRAIEINEQMQDLHDKLDLSSWQARLWLMQGNLTAAIRWQREVQARSKERSDYIDVTLAKVLIAQRQGRGALEVLSPHSEAAKATGHYTSLIEILVLQALACWIQNDYSPACALMKEALFFAEPQGFIRVFIDAGAAVAELLKHLRSLPEDNSIEENFLISPTYISQLLAAFPDSSTPMTPLNERETEILYLLAAGKKTPDIAAELFLSVNTIKWYIKNIYSKLDVHNRADAIKQGRQLELLN